MLFVPKYPDAVFIGPIIKNLVTLFKDEQYVSGALLWASGENLPVFARVGDSIVWRENEETPGLLIVGRTEAIADSDQELDETHSINFDIILARPTQAGEDEVIGQHAYWYGKALDMMLRSVSNDVLFADTEIKGRGKLQVKGHDYGVTGVDKGAYMRYPLITAEIKVLEGL